MASGAASGTSIRLVVDEESQIGAARRAAIALGHANDLGTDGIGRLAIVVTEAATNILRHAGHGLLVLRTLAAGPTVAIEMLALDKGAGIDDVHGAMRDGFSTFGTTGQGLGAMRRLSDVFEVHSQAGMGTAILARIGRGSRPSAFPLPPSVHDRIGAVCLPLRGETECGDAWQVIIARRRVSVLLVDGLGHGPEAATVARIATDAFPALTTKSVADACVDWDAAMRGTRGAALSLAVIDELPARTVRFAGVGNVEGRVCAGVITERLTPQNGIVGHTMPTVRTTTSLWPIRARLILHSDGVSARWRMEAYPGLMTAHPALIAGVIYRDFARERDDATVLVIGDRVAEGNR